MIWTKDKVAGKEEYEDKDVVEISWRFEILQNNFAIKINENSEHIVEGFRRLVVTIYLQWQTPDIFE